MGPPWGPPKGGPIMGPYGTLYYAPHGAAGGAFTMSPPNGAQWAPIVCTEFGQPSCPNSVNGPLGPLTGPRQPLWRTRSPNEHL